MELKTDNTVYLKKVEQFWNKPYPMKRSDVYDTRSIILKAKVIEVRGDEFKAVLIDNNGFEKDGENFVFHKNELLSNQDYTDIKSLGKWTN